MKVPARLVSGVAFLSLGLQRAVQSSRGLFSECTCLWPLLTRKHCCIEALCIKIIFPGTGALRAIDG